jgi:hypothetical protein
MAQLITPATVKASVPLWTRFNDFFRPHEEFSIEWTSPEYKRVAILWDTHEYEKGSRESFIIRGKPGFCAAVIAELSSKGTILDKRPPVCIAFWNRSLVK